MTCCDGIEWEKDDKPDGVCPACGEPTLEGQAWEVCNYSPIECHTCGDAPCDGSC